MINAQVESLTQRAAYRGLLAANRCLVPANGFYEWKSAERAQLPYYILSCPRALCWAAEIDRN